MGYKDGIKKPLAAGEEIYRLIPQRPPIVMVDALLEVGEASAVTGLTVAPDNIFVERGLLSECGIIEHVAQSAATLNGYWAVVRGIEPSLGYIAEIKKFRISDLPPVGSRLRTKLEVLNDFGGMMLLNATVSCDLPKCDDLQSKADGMEQDGRQLVAVGQMKLFIDSKE